MHVIKLLCTLKPMMMMVITQHYNAVCFDRAIQHWILSLPVYIMNSTSNSLVEPSTTGIKVFINKNTI